MELLAPTEALTRRFAVPEQAIAAEPQAADDLVIQRRGCRVGDVRLLISPETYGELIPRDDICALPNVAPWCLGLVNLRGNLVPVFDVHALLRGPEAGGGKWLLVLGRGQTAAAMTVDELPVQLLLKPEEEIDELPEVPEVLEPHISNVFRHDGQLWLMLDHASLFEALAGRVGTRVGPKVSSGEEKRGQRE